MGTRIWAQRHAWLGNDNISRPDISTNIMQTDCIRLIGCFRRSAGICYFHEPNSNTHLQNRQLVKVTCMIMRITFNTQSLHPHGSHVLIRLAYSGMYNSISMNLSVSLSLYICASIHLFTIALCIFLPIMFPAVLPLIVPVILPVPLPTCYQVP